MSQNRATIFSNGIADFRRSYKVTKDTATEISIPVRKDHVADVLASLNIYGHVTLKSPPSFRPANEDEGSLSIDAENVIEGLVTRLCGARVEIEKGGSRLAGTLVGLQSEQQATSGEPIEARFVVVLTEAGLQKVALRELEQLRFDDDTVQSEIDKALRRNFQQIKPHSTFVELALAAVDIDETEAIVQYTIPAAAWKISYRLRGVSDGKFEFQGFAVVDNNTDEDWNDFLISVVTGEPITFSTDLADSKTPRRKHVNVVRDTALGAVEVEEGGYAQDMMLAEAAPMGAGMPHRRGMALAKMARSMADEDALAAAPAAEMEEAAMHEVSDFCVFEAQTPVSIAAGRSAVIPVFQVTLDDSHTVLHYKTENHAERPFRAIEFHNATPYSLQRGVCTVYEDGIYVGSCLMPATKPAGDCLLPHALETGVRLRHEPKRLRQRAESLRLSQGFCYTSYHESEQTVYRITSSRDKPFTLVLDHDYRLAEPSVACRITRGDQGEQPQEVEESLQHGVRLRIALAPFEKLILSIEESRIEESRMQLVTAKGTDRQVNVHWLQQNLVQTNGPLANDPAIRHCLEIQQRLDAAQDEIRKAESEMERLAARQERLRKNITTGGHDEQTSRWKTQLGDAEEKLVQLEDEGIPQLQEEARRIEDELRDAVLALAVEWRADGST